MKYITRTVWILSLVSLFTDMASEMLYPILPIYLKSIGFSIVLIGVLEGVAEAIAGLSKAYFGKRSDAAGRRVPFVQLGYAMSALSKPMMAFLTYPLWVFFARTIDRLGKGVRTGARDALLSDESSTVNKGKVFGFHRSMDTLGAVLGPALALAYLYFFPGQYKTLFLLAFLPGIAATIATLFLSEHKKNEHTEIKSISFISSFSYWRQSRPVYKKVVVGLLVFALFNSSDVFLLLQAKQMGLTDTAVISIYIFYNLVYALMAFPLGILADKIGLKPMFIAGLCIFFIVYAGMAFNKELSIFVLLFFLYGVYAAATEGISKAWISTITDKNDTATAIGTYAGLQSICAMIASSLTGFVWYKFGAATAFISTAVVTGMVVIYFLLLPKEPQLKIE